MINKMQLLEEKLVRVLIKKYGIQNDCLSKLGNGYQNLVYEYHIGEMDYILRISNSTTRTYEEISSELSFLNYLSRYEVSVSLPVKSQNNELIEVIQVEQKKYYAVAF